jgi:solute carrier family 25 folate transporter 32
MSHERRTQSTPGTDEFAASPPPSAQPFTKTSSGFQRESLPITPVERWAIARSDDTFRALAGAAGGFTSGIVTCPLDVIKTKLQAQGGFRVVNKTTSNAVYRGLIGTGRVIWREEGLRGLYRGLGPIILGYLPTWAVWFTVYGRSKEFFSKHYRMFQRGIEGQDIIANMIRRNGQCVYN